MVRMLQICLGLALVAGVANGQPPQPAWVHDTGG